jgi:hypothetical protein
LNQRLRESKTAAALITATLAFISPLAVPADESDTIQQCASLATDSERIACLEAAIRGQQNTRGAPTTGTAIDAAPAEEPFGLKEEDPPVVEESIDVTVTSVSENLQGKMIFRTEDGQTWVQVDQRKGRFPGVPFDAEIRPATMGSYFVQAAGGRVSIRVRREE